MGCERGVTQALEGLAGVTVLGVDRTRNEARVSVAGEATSAEQMIAAIQSAGRFQARLA
jgi:copper chaperone CopZ